MQVLYVHQSFPAQFGHIARRLCAQQKWRCVFVSQGAPESADGIERIEYKLAGGATNNTHFCSRTFENNVWHCDAIFEALRNRPDVKPDLIVGHSGFGSTLFLRELYPHTPTVNLFEYYYHAHDSDGDMDFRRDLGWQLDPHMYLRTRCRNAMILLDLQNCQLGYCPTRFQQSRFPRQYQPKLRTIFDGIDREIYHGHEEKLRPPLGSRSPRTIAGVQVAPASRILTYVARGMESMRGFDMFMKAAKLIAGRMSDVEIFVVGGERMAYGGDEAYLGEHKSFKDWVLAQDSYDLTRFHFTGWLPETQLAQLLAATDLHIYFTAPFVLSWSMIDAMSCGAVVLGSSTSPVKEMITDGVNGLLADFFNPHEFADKATKVLQDPAAYRPLGRAAEKLIADRYSIDAVMPQMLKLYEDSARQPVPLAKAEEAPARPPSPAPVESPEVDSPALTDRAAGLMSDGAVISKVRAPSRSPFRG
ncbi:MAG: glycosyltransferase [Tepidisphaeraceae bacterium]|jgi:glycosyltransferase involved in cell wall biosynthesis